MNVLEIVKSLIEPVLIFIYVELRLYIYKSPRLDKLDKSGSLSDI